MHAEIISIGDELTSGQRLDTNSQWLSQQLGLLGVRVMFHTTIADDMDANITAFRQASQRVDLVICTGGLGPTDDDLTTTAASATAGCLRKAVSTSIVPSLWAAILMISSARPPNHM